MFKYYYFVSNQKINRSSFDEIIRISYHQYLEIDYIDEFRGIILSDENFGVRLKSIYGILISDLNINLIFLETYKLNTLSLKAIKKLLLDNRYGVYHLGEVIYFYNLKNDRELQGLLENELNKIDKELINTAKTYLDCNMNAILASNTLYIHRNTFNYRLNKFIELTQLDIKNYNNSLIFFLYLNN